MAEAAVLSNRRVLVAKSFQQDNENIRRKVLQSDCSSRGEYGALVTKYRAWDTARTGTEYFSDASSDEDSDSGEETKEEENAQEGVGWLKHYTDPSTHIRVNVDENDSDDGLDTQRNMTRHSIDYENSQKDLIEQMFKNRAKMNETKVADEIVDGFFEAIKPIETPEHTVYSLKIQLLGIREDINRVVSAPARMSLSLFQEKVLCPLMDWLPNRTNYTFYLASNKYQDEKPEKEDDDLCFGSVGMEDPCGIMFQINRGGRHTVDDRRVGLYHVLQDSGDHIYYLHGNQKFTGVAVRYKISVLDVDVLNIDEASMMEVRVLRGRGPAPGEMEALPSWDDLRYDSDIEILGVRAFCVSIDIVRHADKHQDWEVKKAREHLNLVGTDPLDFNKFDVKAAQTRMDEAKGRFPIKKGAHGLSPMDSIMSIMSIMPGMMSSPNEFSKLCRREKCMNCETPEHDLEEGKKLLRCSRCGNAFYCGKECQKEDWKGHKGVCVKTTLIGNKKNKGRK